MGTQDGIVQPAELHRAGAEVNAVSLKEIAARISEIEPTLIRFIENEVDEVVGRLITKGCDARVIALFSTETRRIAFTAVRAVQHGYYSLWRDLVNDDGSLRSDQDGEPQRDRE